MSNFGGGNWVSGGSGAQPSGSRSPGGYFTYPNPNSQLGNGISAGSYVGAHGISVANSSPVVTIDIFEEITERIENLEDKVTAAREREERQEVEIMFLKEELQELRGQYQKMIDVLKKFEGMRVG